MRRDSFKPDVHRDGVGKESKVSTYYCSTFFDSQSCVSQTVCENMCLGVSVYVCLSLSACMPLCMHPCVCLSLHVHVSIYTSFCLRVWAAPHMVSGVNSPCTLPSYLSSTLPGWRVFHSPSGSLTED